MDIKRMLGDLNAERERINKAIAALENLEGTPMAAPSSRSASPTKTIARQPKTGKRRLSAAGRAAIAEAARRRWAAQKHADQPHTTAKKASAKGSARKTSAKQTPTKSNSGMSAAARKRMSEAMKARWAARKAAAAK